MSESEKSNPLSGEFSRRQMLRSIAVALTAAGSSGITLEAGRFVHVLIQEEKAKGSSYQPRFFNDREFRTVVRLAELIIPADDTSGSAVEAGAPEFIDLLCSQNRELARIYTGGIFWLDRAMERQGGNSFTDAEEEQQHRMLKALAGEARQQERKEQAVRNARFKTDPSNLGFLQYTPEPTSTLGPGGRFFVWVRRMTVDAFFTSPIGVEYVGYQGNSFWETYRVPQEAIDYALRRSPSED